MLNIDMFLQSGISLKILGCNLFFWSLFISKLLRYLEFDYWYVLTSFSMITPLYLDTPCTHMAYQGFDQNQMLWFCLIKYDILWRGCLLKSINGLMQLAYYMIFELKPHLTVSLNQLTRNWLNSPRYTNHQSML